MIHRATRPTLSGVAGIDLVPWDCWSTEAISAAATWAAWVDSGAATRGAEPGGGGAGRDAGGFAGAATGAGFGTGSGAALVDAGGAAVTAGAGTGGVAGGSKGAVGALLTR
jgi:hypothetical protein